MYPNLDINNILDTNYFIGLTRHSFQLLQNMTWLPLMNLFLMPMKYSVSYNVTNNECITGNVHKRMIKRFSLYTILWACLCVIQFQFNYLDFILHKMESHLFLFFLIFLKQRTGKVCCRKSMKRDQIVTSNQNHQIIPI